MKQNFLPLDDDLGVGVAAKCIVIHCLITCSVNITHRIRSLFMMILLDKWHKVQLISLKYFQCIYCYTMYAFVCGYRYNPLSSQLRFTNSKGCSYACSLHSVVRNLSFYSPRPLATCIQLELSWAHTPCVLRSMLESILLSAEHEIRSLHGQKAYGHAAVTVGVADRYHHACNTKSSIFSPCGQCCLIASQS